jgi:hypothetical protein
MYIWAKRGTQQIQKVLNYLYADSSIYLNRKFNLYNKVCRPGL